ncbi:MAG: SDR family oxidoreductase [Acidimicrobiia bacterium]|nr:SDR family oxidoreductase [Acidimicrobiia bacterium]
MARLADRVAVVTGGASGMGAATVRRFVAEGAKVLIADLQEDKASALVAELGDAAAFRRVDVTKEDDVQSAVAEAVERWGSLDVMFNNAGFGGVLGPIDTVSEAEFDLTFDVLLKGVFFGIKHAAGPMKAQRSGSIINTASVAGLQCGEASHLYSVAKAAVIHLTKTTALEMGDWQVRVNAICPGVIATPLAAGSSKADETALQRMRDKGGKYQPIGRIGEGEDIANMALFLASDESTFVTGTAAVVDGGFHAGKAWSRQGRMWTTPNDTKLYRPPGR